MTLTTPISRAFGSSLLALPMVLASSALALAQDATFYLYNETSVTLMELYMSPSNVDDWEEDILGSDVLAPGEGAEVTIADGRETCIYDILGVFADDDYVEDYEVNICNLESYSFTED